MKDYYLKFPDEYTGLTALSDFSTGQLEEYDTITENLYENEDDPEEVTGTQEVTREVPVLNKFTHEHAIDIVGVIYQPTGVMITDEEGFEYPETAAVDGYHVNIRSLSGEVNELIESKLSDYIVTPVTPNRVWA